MDTIKRTIPVAALLILTAAIRVEAAVPNLGHLYSLEKASDFQEGCFYLCECPIVMRNDLQGRFTLIPSGTENGYDVFSVVDVEWTVGADLIGPPIETRGSGSYRTSAQSQELLLDLVVGDRKVEHYESGLVPVTVPFPAIDIVTLTYPYGCYDTVIHVSAVPSAQGVRPPKLQFEQTDPKLGIQTTWGRLKKFWVD
jgi:hypothetical protein